MKVIKKGRQQKGWAKQINCTGKGNGKGGCGAVLLIEESDLFMTERRIMGREHETYVTFKCSECGVFTDITCYPGDVNKLPKKPAPEPVTEKPKENPCCMYSAGAEGGSMCDDCYLSNYR